MKDLVEYKNKEIWAESNLVARKMGVKHNKLMRSVGVIIEKIKDLRGTDCTPKYRIESRNYRGRDFEICLMSREFFSLVMMRLETKEAFEWQIKFNSAFYEMEKALLKAQTNKEDLEWNSSRALGKSARAEETDAIKKFVEYATNQGSKNAKFYYSNITNASYRALGLMTQRHPKIRDQMNIYELAQLMLAEKLATDKLIEYMKLERNYKDIYQSVKQDLINFSSSIKLN